MTELSVVDQIWLSFTSCVCKCIDSHIIDGGGVDVKETITSLTSLWELSL